MGSPAGSESTLGYRYNKGYEDGKKEPREVKAVNLEDTSEYQIGYKVGYNIGYDDALEEFCKLYVYENDYKEFFLNVYAKPFHENTTLYDAVARYGIGTVMADFTKWQEEKKKAEEESIKVGDVVKFNENCHNYDHVKSREYLVLHIFDNGLVTLLYDNGDTGAVDISLVDKTGRHIDVTEQLLDKLKGDNNESNN